MTTAMRARPTGLLLAPLRWLERSRGWRRRLLIVSYLFVGMLVGILIWRATSLNRLPDVGDPFDVDAFLASTRVPESEDAFALYRRAGGLMVDSVVTSNYTILWKSAAGGWAKTPPEVRAWVASNREALATWRAGTERPGAMAESLATAQITTDTSLNSKLFLLGYAAIFEGSRLEAEGDRAGAIAWYLAVARSAGHLATRTRVTWRQTAATLGEASRDRLIALSADPKTETALLRKALATIRTIDDRATPDSDTLKAEYVAMARSLDDPGRLLKESGRQLNLGYSYDNFGRWIDVYFFLRREPERGRRVVQLIFANWLAQCDRPVSLRPKAVFDDARAPLWGFYVADPSAPASARAMEPEHLLAWLESTALAWRFLTAYPSAVQAAFRDRPGRAVLMVTLAEELYRRDHGADAPSTKALVPEYLKAVPEGYQ